MISFNTLKSLSLSIFAALSLWMAPGAGVTPASAQGTLPIAMAQQIDINGQPLAGCLANFYVAGTVATPQNVYADFGLTQQLPNPIQCDQTGRVPMFWLANGLTHVRLTDASGVPIIDTTMQVLGPSSGGGGGGSTVDPTTIAATGDLKWRLDKSTLTGWVRINGLTIGSATSGATERANADTQALFVYIWTTFSQPSGNVICPVVGGLGASALADFNANKQLTLQDGRARALFALDDMGNSALGGFGTTTFQQGNATTGGARAGLNSTTLSLNNMATGIQSSSFQTINAAGSVTASGSFNVNSTDTNVIHGSVTSAFQSGTSGSFPQMLSGASAGSVNVAGSVTVTGSTSVSGNNSIAVTSTNTGGQPFPSVPSALLGTLFWKL